MELITELHNFMAELHGESFSVQYTAVRRIPDQRAVGGNAEGNASDQIREWLHAHKRTSACGDKHKTRLMEPDECFQGPGGDCQVIPKDRIIQIEGGCLQGMLGLNHAFRPSTAAFCAGMQRINCSIYRSNPASSSGSGETVSFFMPAKTWSRR